MKILPCMSRGIVFVHEDGKTFEMAPLQVFRTDSGSTVIRIGQNTLWFNESGTFDGNESRCHVSPDSPEATAVRSAFEEQDKNVGLPPEEPYFAPGVPGHEIETRSWSAAQRPAVTEGREMYEIQLKKPRLS